MIQNIIVLIIVLGVVAYVLFALYRNLRAKKSDKCNCGCGCGSSNAANNKHDKIQELKYN